MTAVLEDIQTFVVNEWKTLNTVASPNKLPPGHSPNNQNVWMDEKPGSVITANGYQKLGEIPSGLPVTGLINFFKSSTGSSQLICTDGQNVYWTTDFVNYTTIKTGLSAFFQLRGKVIRDKLWMTNGSDAVMTWDGSSLVELDGSGSLPDVPRGKFIDYHDERVWLYGINGDLSSLRFSALADSSGTEITPDDADAWPSDNEIQISEGDADIGTGIFLYRGYLYCSKQFSVWRIVGYDEYTYDRVKTRASTGTRFQESIQVKDNLVHFIGVDGLYVFDGEEAKRISDIVDPASSDAGVFAFRNLQQPLLNNQFWNVSESTDLGSGVSVPNNISYNSDELLLIPADDSQTDFSSGTHSHTTDSDNPGYLQLDLVNSGSVGSLVSVGKTSSLEDGAALARYGVASYINDGNTSNQAGFKVTGGSPLDVAFEIDLGSAMRVGRVVIKGYYADSTVNFSVSASIQTSSDGSTWATATSVSFNSIVSASGSTLLFSGTVGDAASRKIDESDYTVDFTTTTARYVRLLISATGSAQVVRELEVYLAGYEATGTFVSKSIDYEFVPATYGTLAAAITTNGENYQFFTQSSDDGSTWDAAVNLSNGAAIGSTLRRYLRWGVTLESSTGLSTPVIDKVYVGGTYLSEKHNTGGNIFQWAPFQATFNKSGQTITFYYRSGVNEAALNAASWTAIVNGATPGALSTDDYIQIKIELSTTDATQAPSVQSFTVNWILDSGSGVNTLQNVASIIILNRYWLSAATIGANENDIVIVLGKSTAESPFHKKDFAFLSFCRYQDYYIAGSSTDGSIYRLESGYSKNGSALDSYYETADLSKEGYQIKGRELHVTCDHSGPYDLSVGWSTDGGLTYTERTIDLTRASGTQLSVTTKLNINLMAESVRFRVRINAADKPFSVDEIKLYYKLIPQRGTLIAA